MVVGALRGRLAPSIGWVRQLLTTGYSMFNLLTQSLQYRGTAKIEGGNYMRAVFDQCNIVVYLFISSYDVTSGHVTSLPVTWHHFLTLFCLIPFCVIPFCVIPFCVIPFHLTLICHTCSILSNLP